MRKTGGSLNRRLLGYEIPVGWVHFLAVGGFISFRWWHIEEAVPKYDIPEDLEERKKMGLDHRFTRSGFYNVPLGTRKLDGVGPSVSKEEDSDTIFGMTREEFLKDLEQYCRFSDKMD